MNGLYQPDPSIPFGQNAPPPFDPSLQGSPGYATQNTQPPIGMSQPGGIGGSGPIAAPQPALAAPMQAASPVVPAPVVAPVLAASAQQPLAAAPVAPTLARPAGVQIGPFSVTGSPRSPVPIPRPPMVPGFGHGVAGHNGGVAAQPMNSQPLQALMQRVPQLAGGQHANFGLIGALAPRTPAGGFMQPGGPGNAGPIAATGYPSAGSYELQV